MKVNYMQAIKITLLIVILAKEIKKIIYWFIKLKKERDQFRREYTFLVNKFLINHDDKI